MAVCERDQDCPGTLVCYIEPSWNDGVTLCTCSHWYGWQGSDCLETGPASYSLVAMAAITLVCGVAIFVVASRTLVQYARAIGFKSNAQVATMIFVWLTSLFLIMWRCVVITQALTPDRNTLELKANNEDKVHQLTPFERAMLSLTLMFTTLAMLNVSLMWVQVALQSQRMTRAASRSLTTYRKTIYGFEVTWVLGLIVFMGLGLTAFAFLFAAPFLAFIVITYAYGAHKMNTLLTSVGKAVGNSDSGSPASPVSGESGPTRRANSRYDVLIRRIRRTAVGVVVALLFGFVSVATYSLLTILPANGSRSVINPDKKLHFVVFALEMMPVALVLSSAAVLIYLRQNIKGAVQATTAASSKQLADSSKRDSSSSFEKSNTYAFTSFQPATPKSQAPKLPESL